MTRVQSFKNEEFVLDGIDNLEVDSESYDKPKRISYKNLVLSSKDELDKRFLMDEPVTYDSSTNTLTMNTNTSFELENSTFIPFVLPKGLPLIKANALVNLNGTLYQIHNSYYHNQYGWGGLDQGTIQVGLNFLTFDKSIQGGQFTLHKMSNRSGTIYYKPKSAEVNNIGEQNLGYFEFKVQTDLPVENYPILSKVLGVRTSDFQSFMTLCGYGNNTTLAKVNNGFMPDIFNELPYSAFSLLNESAYGTLEATNIQDANYGGDFEYESKDNDIFYYKYFVTSGSIATVFSKVKININNTVTMSFAEPSPVEDVATRQLQTQICIGL